MSDRIEKRIELNAPVSRVWRALTDYQQFGQWFRVKLESPFAPGDTTRGRITDRGYEQLPMELVVARMEPARLFSFTCHPYAVDSQKDYSQEPPTLVEFRLEKKGTVRSCSSPNPGSTVSPKIGGSSPSAPTTPAGRSR